MGKRIKRSCSMEMRILDLDLRDPGHPALTAPAGLSDFSVRWMGFLKPTDSGTYRIGLVRDMHRLWNGDIGLT